MKKINVKNNKLLVGKINAEKLIQKYGSPLYVYDANTIRERFNELKNNLNFPNTQIYYACKANSNPSILGLLKKQGAFVEVVSKGEIAIAVSAGFDFSEMIYTSSNITNDELKFVIDKNILINLDSLHQLEQFGKTKPGAKISIRINQGIGAGGHKHLITGGGKSKFGIDIAQLDEVRKIVKRYNLEIIGIHQHIGTSVGNEKVFIKSTKKLLQTAKQFENLEFVDFGGGFGVPYNPEKKSVDIKKLGKALNTEIEKFIKPYGKNVSIKFEIGRFLVAESGFFLAEVVDIKRNPNRIFVGLNAGMNQFMRPAMYGAYHGIVNASRVNSEKETVSVVGDICESADFFAMDRNISKFRIGDICAILDTGAYGYSMSSNYNGRPQPAEVLVDGENSRLIRKEKII